jgi:1,4-dihydroxy-2-naphthoate octaprenyltransferase
MSATTLPGRILSFVRLGRPLFLAGGFVMHGLGVAAALYGGAPLSLPALVWGQVAITATQFMTHYSNDYFDLAADRANRTPTAWSGGSRVLAEENFPARIALVAALVFGLIALGADLTLAFVLHSGRWSLPLLLLAQGLAWGYSAPPLRLHAHGLGQLTGVVVVSGLTPLIGFYLQAGRLAPWPSPAILLLAIFPLCCLQFAMLLAVDIPDAAGDAAVGKRTLVVQLGAARASSLYLLATLLAYASLPVLALAGLPPLVAAAPCLTLPLATWQILRTARGAWSVQKRWNSLIFWTIALLITTAVLETLAFLRLARLA